MDKYINRNNIQKDMSIFLTSIQRFSLHDGPGIRTTVFLKGCLLRCPWCSNPENLSFEVQKYVKNKEKGVYGKKYEVDELYAEIEKDKSFYGGEWLSYEQLSQNPKKLDDLPGGVTFSGGECLLQMSNMLPLLDKLKKNKIHIAVETSLFAPPEQLEIAMQYVDLFYVDIKLLSPKRCKKNLKGNLDLYLSNWERLSESRKAVVVRIPVIAEYTDDEDNRENIIEFVKKNKSRILKVELIKEHSLGVSKYKSLIEAGNNLNMPVYKGIEDMMMEKYQFEIVRRTNLWTEICMV